MEIHPVKIILIEETQRFKGQEVNFYGQYEYCDVCDELLESEELISRNNLAMKDSYRENNNLLTSQEIIKIRENYGVSQKDLSKILDWGEATITRYENYQVQERAYDDILRKIDSDPKWFLDMLDRAEDKLAKKAYKKYKAKGQDCLFQKKNDYLISSIESCYAKDFDDSQCGATKLNISKIIEIINYYASKVTSLHKVKLMKMLWYADALSFKIYGASITGLVYQAYPMGALPLCHNQIINLKGVSYDEIAYDNGNGIKFKANDSFSPDNLSNRDLEILEVITKKFGDMNGTDISEVMHQEKTYQNTELYSIIPFSQELSFTIE